MIHNGQFAECEVLGNFQGLCGPRTRTCKLVLEDKDFPRGLQHWVLPGYVVNNCDTVLFHKPKGNIPETLLILS